MKRVRALALTVAIACSAAPCGFSQATIQQILTNGPTSKRLNIVFLSEGYTAPQLGQFIIDARNVLNKLLNTPPFNEYPGYFNAFAISVASAQSGSSHPLQNIKRNTYFNSTYYSYGIERLLTIPPNDIDSNSAHGLGKVDALLASLVPEYDIVVLIVNDTEYGGSGGFPLVASVGQSSADIAIHELGHSFSDLGDEYADPLPDYPDIEEPNTTTETNRALIKWNAWILDSTPVPTPETSAYVSVVGLFEGAHYHTTGWYRPKYDCKMNHLFAPFCEVCSEALVKSVYEQIRPIDSLSPATNQTVSMTNSDTVSFSVTPLMPTSYGLSIQWFINDAPVNGATTTVFSATGFNFASGINKLQVQVIDNTAKVRTDPGMLLKDSATWTVRAVITQPRLLAVPSGDRVTLSWTTNATGFRLESTPVLFPAPAWMSLLTISNQASVTLDVTNQNTFFRLQKP